VCRSHRRRKRARTPVASPSAHPGPGRELLLGGAGLVALVLFGGIAWRALARVNIGVNTGAAIAAASIRDRVRIGPALRRLMSP
jgi:hypothetical protein